MNDLEKFTDLLFGELKGYVCSAVKADKWVEKFFSWPQEREQLHDWINVNNSIGDVYLSPVLYNNKRADKASVKVSQVAWVEFDGDEEIKFPSSMEPTAIVQTSLSTHLHAYWKIDPVDSPSTLEDLNRRLTYFLGADCSGWDSTQLLRPPLTNNYKYEETPPVVLAHLKETNKYPLNVFDVAPTVEIRNTTVKLDELKDAKKLLLSTPLPLKLRNLIREGKAEHPYRSSFLSKLAFELAEEGIEHIDIVSFLSYVDERIGKFSGRTDRLLRLSNLADLAIYKARAVDGLAKYTLDDILEHTEDLKWIIPGWLHQSGFLILTSAPSVGKTQLAYQLSVSLLSREPFLNKVVLRDTPVVLFLSIEMDIQGCKYILSHQKQKWPENLDRSKLLTVDDEGTLLQYEDLIEETGATVVVIDSLSELLEEGNDEKVAAKTVMRWIRKIRRRYNCAVVAIHHNRKASDTNRKPKKLSDLYGSFHFARVVETVVCLWEDTKGIELSVIKARFSRKETFHIKRDNETLWFERLEDAPRESRSDSDSKRGGMQIFGFGDRHGD